MQTKRRQNTKEGQKSTGQNFKKRTILLKGGQLATLVQNIKYFNVWSYNLKKYKIKNDKNNYCFYIKLLTMLGQK